MQPEALREQLIQFITDAKLDDFFVRFRECVRGDAEGMTELYLQKANWSRLKRERNIRSQADYDLAVNNVCHTLIGLARDLTAADLFAPAPAAPPVYQFDYELNRADREQELWEVNTFCDEAHEMLQRFVVLVADRDAEAFVDRWLLEQAKMDLHRHHYEQEEKENGLARGIQVWNWEYGRVALQQRIRQGLQQARKQGGDARFVAFIRIPGDFLRRPGPRLLEDLAAIAGACTGENSETCAAFIFLHLEEAPGSPEAWQQDWKTCLPCMMVRSEWSAVNRKHIGKWLAGRGLAPWEEDEYLNQWIPPGQEGISMRYFRGYAREFLSTRDRY